jgi:tetrahydromethanopterin S-methyltransferase subunit A
VNIACYEGFGGLGGGRIMLKVSPHPDYPPEEGRYLRGNDSSPVAVAIVLNNDADKVPPEVEKLVRAGVESGAALSGTVQTENIGFEKIVCNIIANTNIRYMVLGGPESEGHSTGEALKALFSNGVDEKKRIIGTDAPHPFLFNLPMEFIERFRKQVTLIDLQFNADLDIISQALWSCYQEEPVKFKGYSLCDPGAYPEPPLSGRITWRVTEPWAEPGDEKEREALKRIKEQIERSMARSKKG